MNAIGSMNVPYPNGGFADEMAARAQALQSNDYKLSIQPAPFNPEVDVGNGTVPTLANRPFVVELKTSFRSDPYQKYVAGKHFMVCSVAGNNNPPATYLSPLAGTLVASPQPDVEMYNFGGTVFIFDGLLIRVRGMFRLRFDLFEIVGDQCIQIQSVTSDLVRRPLAGVIISEFSRSTGV